MYYVQVYRSEMASAKMSSVTASVLLILYKLKFFFKSVEKVIFFKPIVLMNSEKVFSPISSI